MAKRSTPKRSSAKKTMVRRSPTASPAATATGPDAITLLKNDHRKVDGLFRSFEGTSAGQSGERRRIVDEVIRELSVHASIEEQIFYPAVRRALPQGDQMVSESLDEHQEVKETLAKLEDMDPSAPQFQATVTTLIRDVRHHVQEEESEILPGLQRTLNREQLMDIGSRMERAKGRAPTRPHPNAPSTPPVDIVTDLAGKAFDRAKEGISNLVGS